MAYAHFPVERKRQSILIGSTNGKAYLTDPTGARRFWPVEVVRFDVEGIRRDRDQIWAEALKRERMGESIRLPESLWELAGEHQERRREVDAWEPVLEGLVYSRPVWDSSGRVRIPLEDVWVAVQPDPARRDRSGGLRISEIMHRLGFERGTMKLEGKMVRAYLGKPVGLDLSGSDGPKKEPE